MLRGSCVDGVDGYLWQNTLIGESASMASIYFNNKNGFRFWYNLQIKLTERKIFSPAIVCWSRSMHVQWPTTTSSSKQLNEIKCTIQRGCSPIWTQKIIISIHRRCLPSTWDWLKTFLFFFSFLARSPFVKFANETGLALRAPNSARLITSNFPHSAQ